MVDETKQKLIDILEDSFYENLIGTSLDSWEDALEIETEILYQLIPEDEVLLILDSIAFNCENCGWWYHVDENNNFDDANLCDSCYEDYRVEDEEDW